MISTLRVLEVLTQLRLHWKDKLGYCAPLKPVTTVKNLPGFLTFEETTCQGGFLVSELKITIHNKKSQHILIVLTI